MNVRPATSTTAALSLLVALIVDRTVGEPPNAAHPVVWLGQLISSLDRRAPRSHQGRLAYGGLLWVTVVSAAWAPAQACLGLSSRVATPVATLLVGLALKPAFAWRALVDHVRRVHTPLAGGDLPAARRALSMIVSRPTTSLDESLTAAAAIESLAENLSDSLVAPLFWYSIGGLPAAWLYRAANTMDAMIGYHTDRYEHLGKVTARIDDALNWAPSRLTAALLILAGALTGGDPRLGQAIWRRDAAVTASPNAGQPMATMAGLLGVELQKVDHYRLGAGLRAPVASDIQRAIRITEMAGTLAAGAALAWQLRHRDSQARRTAP